MNNSLVEQEVKDVVIVNGISSVFCLSDSSNQNNHVVSMIGSIFLGIIDDDASSIENTTTTRSIVDSVINTNKEIYLYY